MKSAGKRSQLNKDTFHGDKRSTSDVAAYAAANRFWHNVFRGFPPPATRLGRSENVAYVGDGAPEPPTQIPEDPENRVPASGV